MSDDTGRRRKVHIEGDVERASKHKQRAQSAAPVEIDPEETPPPREPPSIATMPGFESLPDELRAILLSMHHVQQEHDVGLTRVWDARHVKNELAAVNEVTGQVLDRLGRLGNMPALLQQASVQIGQLVAWKEASDRRERRLDATLDALDKRLDTIERDYVKLDQTIAVLAREITAGFAASKKSVEDLARELEDEVRRLETKLEKQKDEHNARITSLEHSRTSATARYGVIAAIAAFVIGLIYFVAGKVWK